MACGRDDLFFLVFTCLFLGRKINICGRGDLFFDLHLFLGRKIDTCGRGDLFFGLHLLWGRKMDICGCGDLYLVFPCFGAENSDPVVNRGPRFFFFLSTTLNLTHHLKRFAIPALGHKHKDLCNF